MDSRTTTRPACRAHLPTPFVRKLRAAERGLLAEHLLRLPEYDRAMRFMGTVRDAHIERYASREDGPPRLVLGYFCDGKMRAAGELVFLAQPAWRGACEAALSVEPAWQRAGVGSELLQRLVLLARNRGASPLTVHFLRENRRMHGLACKFGMRFDYAGADVTATLQPSWPTYLTVLGELANDGRAVFAEFTARGGPHVLRNG